MIRLSKLDGVTVTGTVPDVRPYLAHARLAVAPMRLARGLQNKVLEALAMDVPVLITRSAQIGLGEVTEEPGLTVATEAEMPAAANRILASAPEPGLPVPSQIPMAKASSSPPPTGKA